MPNWKKVIVSGSDAALNSLLVTDNIELTGSLNVSGSTTQIGNNTLLGNTTLSGSIIISGSEDTATPSIRIFGNTQHDGVIRFDPISTNIDTSISASYIYVSGSTDDLYFSQNGQGYNNVTRLRWLEGNINTGLLWGGVVSGSIGGTTFDVAAGEGIITTLNAFTGSEGPHPTIEKVSWDDFTGVTPTYLTTDPTTWLLIDSSGNLVQQTTSPTEEEFRTHIQVGVLIHPNETTISLFKTFTQPSYGSTQQIFQFIRAFGPIKVSGHIVGDNGANLQLSRTSGTAYAIGRNYAFDPDNPSLMDDPADTAPNIFYYYKESGDFVTTTGTSVINPNQYNEDGDGLSTVNNNKWTIQRIFFFPKSPDDIGVYYGRQQYSTLSDALANLQFEEFEEIDNTKNQAIFLGYLIVEKGATALNNTSEAKFIQGGAFRTTGTGGGGGAPVVTNLEDLNDVAIASVATGDLISWNGAEWQNTVTGINITGSLLGNASTATTASYAVTASHALNAGGTDTVVVQYGHTSGNGLADSSDYFIGMGTTMGNTGNSSIQIGIQAGTLVRADIATYNASTFGSSEASTVSVFSNNFAQEDTISTSVLFNARHSLVSVTGLSISLAAGLSVIKLLTPAFTTNPASAKINITLYIEI